MNAYRTKPIIGNPSPSGSRPTPNDSIGCGQSLLLLVMVYIAWSAIDHLLAGTAGRFDWVICLAPMIYFVVLWRLDNQSKNKAKLARDAETRAWVEGCKEAELTIVDRHYSPSETHEDDYGEFHTTKPRYTLKLEMDADQRAIAPSQTVVSVDLYSNVYEKLEKQNTVRIYYEPATPLTFFLEEELYR